MANGTTTRGWLEALRPEDALVIAWRYDELVRAGYAADAAVALAPRRDVDLHVALDLVGRGCPPSTAFRILV